MRVIVADDSVIVRTGIGQMLVAAGATVCGAAGDADELLALVDACEPDAVVVDIRMPPLFSDEGLRAALRIRERHPRVGVLILSHHVETTTAVQLLAASPAGFGYLLKERLGDVGELSEAVTRVASGDSVIDPEVVARLLDRRRTDAEVAALTDRERAVLTLMAEGRSNDAIAKRLRVGGKTVETHIRNIFTKLGLEPNLTDHRRVLAVLTYLQL